MIKIGLTGNIGCGKSSVSNILRENGFYIIDADKIARNIYEYDDVMEEIREEFSDALVDGVVDRKLLADIVFSDEYRLDMLNSITHKKIRSIINAEIESVLNKDIIGLVIDAPLLIEANFDYMVDYIVVVCCDEEIQIKRVMERDNLDIESVKKRIASQMPQEYKKKRADFVIDNSKTKEDLRKSVLELMSKMKSK